MKRKSIIQQFSICAALFFVISASGCVSIGPTVKTYSEDKLQKSEVAVIKGWLLIGLLQYEGIDIYRIDGSTLKATKVEVLPGWHRLTIRRYAFSIFDLLQPLFVPGHYNQWTTEAELNFEAGHEYIIKYKYEKGILAEGVKIIDVTTGAIIGEFWLQPRN